MTARLRFVILAGVVGLAVGIPVLLSLAARFGLEPVSQIVRAGTAVEYARRQATLRTAFTSPDFLARWKERRLVRGDPVARLILPKLSVDLMVVEGTSGESLRAGAGHYEDSALPGDKGNTAIAGHRSSFGRPFRHLDELDAGDVLHLITPDGRFTYELGRPFDGHANPWVTDPTDWTVVGPAEGQVVTLTTLGKDNNRLIARFVFVKKGPA